MLILGLSNCHHDHAAVVADDYKILAAVLRAFKARTGLPVLVNTSFNAHEEPIVYRPQECLRALTTGRVDYLLTPHALHHA